MASRYGAGNRIVAFAGGLPSELLCHAAGLVTVNSTISTTALSSGVPVKVLGNAVFDIPGLTAQQPLDAFWLEPEPPDAELTRDFLRALIGATQIKGGFYTRHAQEQTIPAFVDRLEGGLYELPPLSPIEVAAREERVKPKRREELSPPKAAEFLIYAVVPIRNRDAVLGDLEESWNSAVSKFGVRAAGATYWIDVCRALRPFIVAGIREIAKISGLLVLGERVWHFLRAWLGLGS